MSTLPGMAHYLFNYSERTQRSGAREEAAGLLRAKMWGVRADESHRNALAAGDLILIYLGAPAREFVGCAELASAVRDWTPSQAQVYPGDSPSGVLLSHVEEWEPPIPVNTVLSQVDPAENATANFRAGVVRITALEYLTVLAASAGRMPSPG